MPVDGICLALVGRLSEMAKPKLIYIADVSETNHRVIVQFVNSVNNALEKQQCISMLFQ